MGANNYANAFIFGERIEIVSQPYLKHLKSSADLVTPYEAVRAGFVALALEKNRRATPFVAMARALKATASQAKTPNNLLKIAEIRPALLTAAGVSDKATNHLQESDKTEAIKGLIETFLEPAGINFVEELVFRFLLTRGDTLGGSMRNVGGFMAEKKLTRSLLAHFKLAGQSYQWLHTETKAWAPLPSDDTDVELQLRGLSWTSKKGKRTLIYNLTVPIVKNNIDLCLFNRAASEISSSVYENPAAYIALGELKGGIDPAGADEHWKTARSALDRINTAFTAKDHTPHTFFIGAAIEAKMADEIWESLRAGTLENAANLTDENQIASITRWLCTL